MGIYLIDCSTLELWNKFQSEMELRFDINEPSLSIVWTRNDIAIINTIFLNARLFFVMHPFPFPFPIWNKWRQFSRYTIHQIELLPFTIYFSTKRTKEYLYKE